MIDQDSLQDLINFLNNTQGNKTVRGETVVNNDQILKNIVKLLEIKE